MQHAAYNYSLHTQTERREAADRKEMVPETVISSTHALYADIPTEINEFKWNIFSSIATENII